ncbi:telomere repeats-binding bouquet formation protein 2 [Bufo gargarizans]|uniref:telomere repeats-binding bouquet formation protein 2 n=1 Tax=Bufo gargarizans TaxID=30331 RepID=UPI001CF5251D|nr:telomere repeats-binding bouquet formation protein 2 [Bufo gargarizans]
MSAVRYVNSMGGTHSCMLSHLAKEFWSFCLKQEVTVVAEYLPGLQNVQADWNSRTSPRLRRSATSTTVGGISPSAGLQGIGRLSQGEDLSDAVRRLLEQSWAPGTRRAYRTAWGSWSGWCVARRVDPLSAPVSDVLEFLTALFEEESEDGIITNSSHQADYLFSMDASHHDTQRIYNSLEYIENKATVFHASFLRSHIQFKTKTMVILGHFILPPPSLHEEIRREIGNFFWEQDNFVDIQQRRDEEDEPMKPEYDKRKTAGREQSADVRLHTLPKYPENNMFSGYTSIDQLRKFSEELHDFIPDTSEYRVLYVHGESSNFPGIKNLNSKK